MSLERLKVKGVNRRKRVKKILLWSSECGRVIGVELGSGSRLNIGAKKKKINILIKIDEVVNIFQETEEIKSMRIK